MIFSLEEFTLIKFWVFVFFFTFWGEDNFRLTGNLQR